MCGHFQDLVDMYAFGPCTMKQVQFSQGTFFFLASLTQISAIRICSHTKLLNYSRGSQFSNKHVHIKEMVLEVSDHG